MPTIFPSPSLEAEQKNFHSALISNGTGRRPTINAKNKPVGFRAEAEISASPDEDLVDAAIVLHLSKNLDLDTPDSPDVEKPHELNNWHWYDDELEAQADSVEKIANITGLSAKKVVPKLRYVLVCFYFFIYVVFVISFSRCSREDFSEDRQRHSATNSVGTSPVCSSEVKLLRSFKFPLISIIGVIVISVITRLVMCFAALCTWRCSTQRALATTLGPFRSMYKLLFLAIVVVLIVIIYVLYTYAFEEEFYFEWEEVFAPAGLATIITVTFGFETDTDFEECFKRQRDKDGYVHGLAHQYFKSSLDPLLRPEGKRMAVMERWKEYFPAETLLVLLVESYHLVEEFFTSDEFAHDVKFVDEIEGMYLMKLVVADDDENFAYVNIPVLLNEHLLIIDEWFSTTSHVTVPLEEQKSEYVQTLRRLLHDKRLPVGGAMGRIFFVCIPNVDIRSIPRIIRQAIFKELGAPKSDQFWENTKLARTSVSSSPTKRFFEGYVSNSRGVSPANPNPTSPQLDLR